MYLYPTCTNPFGFVQRGPLQAKLSPRQGEENGFPPLHNPDGLSQIEVIPPRISIRLIPFPFCALLTEPGSSPDLARVRVVIRLRPFHSIRGCESVSHPSGTCCGGDERQTVLLSRRGSEWVWPLAILAGPFRRLSNGARCQGSESVSDPFHSSGTCPIEPRRSR